MLAQRTNPTWALDHLRREVDRLFENFEPRINGGFTATRGLFPALNIWEDGENLYAEAEIPGVRRDDLEVYAVGRELTIKGRRQPVEGQNLAYHRQERGTGEFTRVVTLPIEVNANRIEAALRDGVLKLTLPKADEVKPKKISVQAG